MIENIRQLRLVIYGIGDHKKSRTEIQCGCVLAFANVNSVKLP
ncbi:hypothetical protein [Methylobacter tundripaludum]|nr:hypothetical protein [Methylobacter tundripaludum]